ncbi:lipoyl synthase [Myxococcota bacterium]|nr:lipoyl synthase [Myxococcota bacterium]MBU1380735.1 lipoyl synthase [Myxococcota bacterium]MBU1498037.1 lipoyl synthase [Myxococcota bacterium]
MNNLPRKPSFLKRDLPGYGDYSEVKRTIKHYGLNTVCTGASCPNIGECWAAKSMTIMIMGSICSRNCLFCDVSKGTCENLDPQEPQKTAAALSHLGLRHAVLTSVTRDDLPDGGSAHWASTIKAVHEASITVEALIPDFQGNRMHIDSVIESKPEILSHNVETVPSLSPHIRPLADYRVSLEVLKYVASKGLITKSGLMLGMGENISEVIQTMHELRESGVRVLTLGQYLMPSRKHYPVSRYLEESEYEDLKFKGLEIGFDIVESGPLVRSSWNGASHVKHFFK